MSCTKLYNYCSIGYLAQWGLIGIKIGKSHLKANFIKVERKGNKLKGRQPADRCESEKAKLAKGDVNCSANSWLVG